MTVTIANEFKKMFERIPKDRWKHVWFFPIRQNKKNPDVPGGTVLKGNLAYRLYIKDCFRRLNSGKNVGIYALSGGLMFLDLDMENGKLKASDEFLAKVTPSFCVKTRNGGLQYYYLNDGKYPNCLIEENGVVIGELRTDWYYVVSAGSYVNPDNNGNGDGTYRVISDVPMVPFSGLDEYIEKRESAKEPTKYSKNIKAKDEIDIKDYKKKLRKNKKRERRMSNKEIQALIAEIRRK